jgi:hypothetical protein
MISGAYQVANNNLAVTSSIGGSCRNASSNLLDGLDGLLDSSDRCSSSRLRAWAASCAAGTSAVLLALGEDLIQGLVKLVWHDGVVLWFWFE